VKDFGNIRRELGDFKAWCSEDIEA